MTTNIDPQLLHRAVDELGAEIAKHDRWLCWRASALRVGSYEPGAFVAQLALLAARSLASHEPGKSKLSTYYFRAVRWAYLRNQFWRDDVEGPRALERADPEALDEVCAPQESTWCDEVLELLGDGDGALMDIVREKLRPRDAQALLRTVVDGLGMLDAGKGLGENGGDLTRERVRQLKARALHTLRYEVVSRLARQGYRVEMRSRLGA